MEEFMQAFEENKAKEMDNLGRIESEILNCMEKISRNVHLAATLPELVVSPFSSHELWGYLNLYENSILLSYILQSWSNFYGIERRFRIQRGGIWQG